MRMVFALQNELGTEKGTAQRVANQLGYGVESVRSWVKQAEIDRGVKPGTTSAEAAENKRLKQEVKELKRANEILKRAATFFGAETSHPSKVTADGITAVEFTKVFELLLDPAFIQRAQEHAQRTSEATTSTVSDQDINRIWADVVTNYESSEVENNNTPDLVKVGGLKDDHLVGVEGLEPPTLSV